MNPASKDATLAFAGHVYATALTLFHALSAERELNMSEFAKYPSTSV